MQLVLYIFPAWPILARLLAQYSGVTGHLRRLPVCGYSYFVGLLMSIVAVLTIVLLVFKSCVYQTGPQYKGGSMMIVKLTVFSWIRQVVHPDRVSSTCWLCCLTTPLMDIKHENMG
ncbi:MAG: hypothetical protein OIF57_15855 [Marinobacterium sp.]|nr:hypothetical protein [Marinobacterium sp.]